MILGVLWSECNAHLPECTSLAFHLLFSAFFGLDVRIWTSESSYGEDFFCVDSEFEVRNVGFWQPEANFFFITPDMLKTIFLGVLVIWKKYFCCRNPVDRFSVTGALERNRPGPEPFASRCAGLLPHRHWGRLHLAPRAWSLFRGSKTAET